MIPGRETVGAHVVTVARLGELDAGGARGGSTVSAGTGRAFDA